MSISIILLLIIIVSVVVYSKHFSSFIFIVAITDIFLRIVSFLKSNIGLPDFERFLNKYFPDSIFFIIEKYTSGDITIILKWLFVIIMMFFLYYVTRTWLKKKKF